MTEYRYGKWHTIQACHACKHRLTDHEVFHRGVKAPCPYCGDTAGHYHVKVERAVRRKRYTVRWLLGFIPVRRFHSWEYR